MNNLEITRKYFDFLVTDYKFSVSREFYDSQAMGNSIVVYTSEYYGIDVVVDRNQVLIAIGQISEPKNKWFDFTDVVHYYASNLDTVYIFPEKTNENTLNEICEEQAVRSAKMLKQYCEPLLLGKPWDREEIRKKRGEWYQK